jgi:membrane fusion protein, multidrug efflux system
MTSARANRVRAGLAAGLALGVATGCRGSRGAAQAPPAPVVVASSVQRDFPVELRAIGSVEALASVAVRPQVSAQIDSVHFRDGDDVRQDQLLFSLDRRPFDAALAQAQGSLARDQAQARNAELEAQRAQQLFTDGVLSKEQHDQLQANFEALTAAVAADAAAVQNARVQLDYCSIRSPLDGRTGSVLVKAGNVVKAIDGGPLVVINQIDPIYVSFAVPEVRLPEVKAAAAARRLSVEARITGEASRPLEGELVFLDNAVDTTTGTVKLRGRFKNPAHRLWPGQFVDVRLAIDVLKDAVVVPSAALQDGQSGRYLYVMKPDHTVELREVVVGPDRDGEAVVEKGLAAGETVVTDGQVRLVPGARVQPKAAVGAAS